MKRIKLSLTFFFAIVYCIQLKANTAATQYDTTITNNLTKKEKATGWQLLFDGKTLTGWRTFKNEKGSWKAENGTLCSHSADAGNADLITDSVFNNFELDIDWKISAEGNSGILYMVTEDYDHTYLSGPEYQLIDDDGFPEKIEDWQNSVIMSKKKDGSFTCDITLPKNSYHEFKYRVNEDIWLNEPEADGENQNMFGGSNSVINL